jgi:hypothetical protein
LRAAAKQRGWELVDVIADEGESGGKSHEKRPGLSDALARVERGEADALAVAKLDRLSRSVRDLADLAERSRPRGKRPGWGLILLDTLAIPWRSAAATTCATPWLNPAPWAIRARQVNARATASSGSIVNSS